MGSGALPPPTSGGPYWNGWNIARGVAVLADGTGGYVVDGYGGAHRFGIGSGTPPPALTGAAYWNGWDIARGVALIPDGTGGYTIDGYGGVHGFGIGLGAAPGAITGAAYWRGWDIARGIAVLPNGKGGYILDGFGGLHPFGIGTHAAPPAATGAPYWPGWNIARGVTFTADGTGGYIVDGFGGLHPFGIGTNLASPGATGAPYWPGWDIARGVAVFPGASDGLHAAVSISPATGVTPLRVVADASVSTDPDSTPIANYRFDFGDGTIVGPQTNPTASHTYTTAGSYTVGVTVTDTAGHTSPATAATPVVADSAPTASLLVTPAWNLAPLAVTADASASSDTDATPITTYRFDFGDGTTIGPQTAATASHTYGASGTYPVNVTVTDSGGLTGTTRRNVDVAPPSPSDVAVFAGYYDTHHPHHLKSLPDPWLGSNNTVFVGLADPGTGGWDSGAVRVDNTTSGPLTVTVTVTIDKTTYDLWGARVIPAHQSLVLAQTAFENFDGSDTNIAGKYGSDPALCDTSVLATVPVINVTVDGLLSHYFDREKILNTGGVDSSGCPYTGTRNDESEPDRKSVV